MKILDSGYIGKNFSDWRSTMILLITYGEIENLYKEKVTMDCYLARKASGWIGVMGCSGQAGLKNRAEERLSEAMGHQIKTAFTQVQELEWKEHRQKQVWHIRLNCLKL